MPDRVGVGGIFRRLERHLHVRLGGEIVDFVRLRFLDDANQVGRVGQITVMQDEARIGHLRIFVEMLDRGRC